MVAPRLVLQQPLADELLEQRVLYLGALKDGRIVFGPHRSLHALLLLAQRVAEVGVSDLAARNRGHLSAAIRIAKIVTDADKCERQGDQAPGRIGPGACAYR